ncbi:hypothetical protein DSO57_1025527 [Entomophthora muscae]|uniref:Uncharacterized protein n=1 Tax=Entomophthora muscae TaxID=34485 RepID=A0ACC2SR94_9FUNG|nr:hypothetical protein DSO57_1025527 [Entomophthora muscae]
MQGLAIHINMNPEKHKQLLGLGRLAPGQKESIDVGRDQFILDKFDNDWQGVFPELQYKMATKIDRPLYNLLSTNFSTSTPLSQSISALTITNAFKAYFEYSVTTMCGIPEIALMGTRQDWALLRQSTADLLSKFNGLDYWLRELLPVLDEFIHTSNNKRNVEFWSNIYKPDGGSGGPYIRGWINSLFPYIQTGAGFTQNPHMAWKGGSDPFSGLQYNQIPLGFTDTPFTWNYSGQKFNVSFVGGFLGVEKGPFPNYVAPTLAWSILHNKH